MQRAPGPGGRARAVSEFARRARERMARGEPLTLSIGGTEVVVPPELRQPVLAVLEAGAAGRAGAAAGAGDDWVGEGPAAGGLPPLPLDLPAELTPGQAADLLGINRAALAHMLDRGELAARRDGPRRVVATADVLALRDSVRGRRTATMADVIAASRDLELYPRRSPEMVEPAEPLGRALPG